MDTQPAPDKIPAYEAVVQAMGASLRLPWRVCDRCKLFLPTPDISILSNKIFANLEMIESSAKDGCGVCSFLLSEAFFRSDDGIETNKSSSTDITVIACMSTLHTRCNVKSGDYPFSDTHIDDITRFNIWSTKVRAIGYDSINQHPSTRDALPLVRHWLQVCQSSHADCNVAPKPFTPTRLVEIKSDVPRLRVIKDLQAPVSYAALSHCWGSLDFLRLTQDKLSRFQIEIPFSSLTKTFREAIAIAKYLGIGYIWIDSLCILQDSEEDWNRESALMAEVYGQCTVNIAATAAADGNDGCFSERKSTWRRQLTDAGQLYDLCTEDDLFPSRNPLQTRAWVMQERYLSPRTIHLGDKQVYWECAVNPACEIFPMGYRTYLGFAMFGRPMPSAFTSSKRLVHRRDWWEIIQEYSRCKLTKSQDKLVALGGLAKLVQQSTPHRYLCGMWDDDLIDQLHWYREYGNNMTCKRIVPYVAPTWSWASVDGYISCKRGLALSDSSKTITTIQDIHTSYSSEDIFGTVVSARLTIRCEFLHHGHISIESRERRNPKGFLDMNSHILYISLWLDDDNLGSIESVYALPMETSQGQVSKYITGLLLESTGRKGEYRRLGLFDNFPEDGDMKLLLENNFARPDAPQHFTTISKGKDGKYEYFIDLV